MSDAQTPFTAPAPTAAARTAPLPSDQVPMGYSVDELYDFLDFFDATADDVSAYILHCTRAPGDAEKLTLDVYLALLQRRRFFFWKQTSKLATALALADRLIASEQRWREDGEGTAYVQELLRSLPSAKDGDAERLRHLQRSVRALTFRLQRMAVLACFLRFPPSRTAALLGAGVEAVKGEYAEVFRSLGGKLREDASFRNVDPEQFLRSLRAPALSEEKKRAMRRRLLERSQSGREVSIRFALPVAVVMLLATAAVALPLAPPISASGTRQRIAAAEILLLTRQFEVERNLAQAERGMQSIGAFYAEKEIADIAINLAPSAVRKQVTRDAAVRSLLRRWEDASRPLVSALEKFLTSVDTSS